MKTAEINGLELEYEVVGSGEPVLLVSPVLADGFLPLLSEPAVANHYHLIRYHKQGWVGSTHTPQPVSDTRWENRATRVTQRSPAPFHASIAAPPVHGPVLVEVAPDDEMPGADPWIARDVATAIAGPTEIVDVDGGHFGLLYHPSRLLEEPPARRVAFLQGVLAPVESQPRARSSEPAAGVETAAR